jgi:hypothetical protein
VGHLWFAYQRFSNIDWIEFDRGILDAATAADFRAWAGPLGFNLDNDADSTAIYLPDWFAILTVSALSAVPWIRWSKRFSLRTLLIATTLVAVVLGAIVYAVR